MLRLLVSVFIMLGMLTSCSDIISDTTNESSECVGNDEVTECYISGAEIEALMQQYLLHEMYTVYDSLNADSSSVDESGIYFKVSDENYDTWDEWIAFYESIFAGVALEEQLGILETEKVIKNIDGYTYCIPGGMGWTLSNEYLYDIVRCNQTRALVEISRTEHNFGESDPTERIWYFLLGLTDDGWRILDIISF